ncbi:N-succinylglutamate 5-semialdehyde dehydrogenase [Dirofilaria immitis]
MPYMTRIGDSGQLLLAISESILKNIHQTQPEERQTVQAAFYLAEDAIASATFLLRHEKCHGICINSREMHNDWKCILIR